MVTFRRTSLQLSSLALLSTVLVLGAPVAAHAAVSNPTASSVIKAAKAMIVKETGVHVKVNTISGKVDSSVVADIGTTSGTETYLSGNETFTITVTPTYAYLSGSKSGLTTLMGLSAAEQKLIGKSAMAMKKGNSHYTTFKQDLTASATFKSLLPAVKGTTLLAKRDKKTQGYQLSWTTKATSSAPKTSTVMVISSGSQTLPLEQKVTTSTGNSSTVFSKWGENVKVSVPSKTIAYAKVFPAS